jgi:hypothetical protein
LDGFLAVRTDNPPSEALARPAFGSLTHTRAQEYHDFVRGSANSEPEGSEFRAARKEVVAAVAALVDGGNSFRRVGGFNSGPSRIMAVYPEMA